VAFKISIIGLSPSRRSAETPAPGFLRRSRSRSRSRSVIALPLARCATLVQPQVLYGLLERRRRAHVHVPLQLRDIIGRGDHGPVLYVSGEEAPSQLKLRATRLGLEPQVEQRLWVLHEQRVDAVCKVVRAERPRALIVDSIQTVFAGPLQEKGLGTTQQVGEAAYRLAQLAKAQGLPVFLIGHVTKGGEFAGPKAIEHLVDVALYLEGARDGDGIVDRHDDRLQADIHGPPGLEGAVAAAGQQRDA